MEIQCLVWHEPHLVSSTGAKQRSKALSQKIINQTSPQRRATLSSLIARICVPSSAPAICLHKCCPAVSKRKRQESERPSILFLQPVNSFIESACHCSPAAWAWTLTGSVLHSCELTGGLAGGFKNISFIQEDSACKVAPSVPLE